MHLGKVPISSLDQPLFFPVAIWFFLYGSTKINIAGLLIDGRFGVFQSFAFTCLLAVHEGTHLVDKL